MVDRYKVTPAVFVAVHDNESVLLHRRKNTGFMNGYYDVASGHLEPGEIPTEAAARELQEEYGLTTSPEDLELFHIVMNESDTPDRPYIYLFFRVPLSSCSGEYEVREPNKADDIGLFPVTDLPKVLKHVSLSLADFNAPGVKFSHI